MTVHFKKTSFLKSELKSLSIARGIIREFLKLHNLDAKEIDINLAVGEVLTNVLRYGFNGGETKGLLKLTLQFKKSRISVTIEDNAPPSNPKTWKITDRLPTEGGHGLKLIYNLASKAEFEATPNGNKAKLEFNLA
ncbi:ATP-binding protein [Alphaproteobacteria bacterium]|nr:ATP-binding protein [Alphaproteobacteria bacterium]